MNKTGAKRIAQDSAKPQSAAQIRVIVSRRYRAPGERVLPGATSVRMIDPGPSRELRAADPTLPVRLFRSRAFSSGNAAGFLMFAALFGMASSWPTSCRPAWALGRRGQGCGCCRAGSPCSWSLSSPVHGQPHRRAPADRRQAGPARGRAGLDGADRPHWPSRPVLLRLPACTNAQVRTIFSYI